MRRDSSRRSPATAMRRSLPARLHRRNCSRRMVPLTKIAPGAQFAALPVGAGDRLFVLTGAGISAESGVRTFRDAGGLWEEHRIEDVATPEGFERDPRMVWRFYAERRRHAVSVRPNPAHLALARLEAQLGDRLFLCTQNV